MDNLLLSLNVVLPLAIILGVGMLVKKIGIIDDRSLGQVNKLTFRVFLSTNLFMNVYSMSDNGLFTRENLFPIIYAIAWILVLIVVSLFLFKRLVPDHRVYPVLVQGVYRSNLVLFGLPVCMLLYPDKNLSMIYLAIALIVPLYNVSAVFIFEDYNASGISVLKVIRDVFKNPLVDGAILGFIFWALKIPLPQPVKSALSSMALVATPLAFVVLGASIQIHTIMGRLKNILTASLLRLVFVPGIVILPALAMGMRDLAIVTLISIFASPAAVSSFTMAKEEGADEQLAAGIVAATTLLSIVTVFVWIFVLKNLRVI